MDRTSTRVRVTIPVVDANDPSTSLGATRDISQTGLYLLTELRWPVGHEAEIRILHVAREVALRIRVMRTLADGVGVLFVDVTDEQRAAVEGIVSNILSRGDWFDAHRSDWRAEITGTVTWSLNDKTEESQLVDLSPHGAQIATDQPPEVGNVVTLRVDDGAGSCDCRGRVAHRSPRTFGVAFVDPSTQFDAAIRRMLSAGQSPTQVDSSL